MGIREGVFHLRLCRGVGATAVASRLDGPCNSVKFYVSKFIFQNLTITIIKSSF